MNAARAQTTLILPTYNERETLPGVLDRLRAVAAEVGLEVVVVDDASPDGTADVAERLGRQTPFSVRVVSRAGKAGLASAVLDGAAAAAGAVLAVMDSDGSHPTDLLPALVAAVREDADVAVASRYVAGGRIERWPLWRRLTSLAATVIARLLFRLPVHDPLSGYFAARREVFARRTYWGIGFKVLLELLARNPGMRVAEIPYTFVDRSGGSSKLSRREVTAYLRLLGRILRERKT